MVGLNRYKMAENCLKPHVGKALFLEPLKALVEKNLASTEKTILSYLKLMRTQGLIKEITIGTGGITKWKIMPQETEKNTQLQSNQTQV